eukprot:TRINITY_DN14104_c0_g1_i1.p1 TRINITY_DN14104_c0_g1~~TRINITY_DN14104_c0_g1_i1.p1  ORF type:complete len:577 (+),score=114.32 TRINITY_DN14104_c0_g1_i1:271-2001(+)
MAWTGTTRRGDSENLLARLRVFHLLSRDQVERLPFFMGGEEMKMTGDSCEAIRKFMLSFQVKSVALGQSHPNPVDHTSNLGGDYLYMTSDTKMKNAGVADTHSKSEELHRIKKQLFQNDGQDYFVYSCTEVPKYVLCHMIVSNDVRHHQDIVEEKRSKIISPPRRPTHVPGSVLHSRGVASMSPVNDIGQPTLQFVTPTKEVSPSPEAPAFGNFLPSKRSPTTKPSCKYDMHCPHADDRSHLDNYVHPCPRFFETGSCHLVDDMSHIKYFSHHLQRGECGGSVVVLSAAIEPPVVQPPVVTPVDVVSDHQPSLSPEETNVVDITYDDAVVLNPVPETVLKRPTLSPPTRRTPVKGRSDVGMTPPVPLTITKRTTPAFVESAPRGRAAGSPPEQQGHRSAIIKTTPRTKPKPTQQPPSTDPPPDWRSVFVNLNEIPNDMTPTFSQPTFLGTSIPIGDDLGVPSGGGITRIMPDNDRDCDLPPSRLPGVDQKVSQHHHSSGSRYQDASLLTTKFEKRKAESVKRKQLGGGFRHAGRSPGIPPPASRPVGSVRRIPKRGATSRSNTPAGSKKLSILLSS